MGEFHLCEIITKAQTDKGAMLDLVTMFQPLLKKYAIKLRYEDAYADLQLDFMEFVYKFNMDTMRRKDNAALLSYIKRTVHNHYLKRIKAYYAYCDNTCLLSEMSDEQLAVVSLLFSTTDQYETLRFAEYQKYLTKQEQEVIVMIYYYGYTVSEISKLKRISRQAVNQTKTRALSKLHKQFIDSI